MAVVALAANRVIGRNNDLPWHLPEDLRHFKQLTLGKTLLMGRRTFESIGRPLPGRQTVVLTAAPTWSYPGVEVIHDLAQAVALLTGPRDVVLAGGGELFRALLPWCDRIEATHVHREVDGDVTFPEIAADEWKQVSREDRDGFSFVGYRRIASAADGLPAAAANR